ncbi:hypothetical protein A1O3_06136 [Capronia epimyces CBS 606.96]|uniref:DUF7924 domain-containing protein n=1 Tax=Capronia epimyces CBS 606.96 TaxID=1182542 RepID=W9XQ26_9EURO|nr:uncharacterized protein A1O3_06136 [Capronia epimyces CBS 606.96]EXJ82323.1 hypothetical protein A1O3_06136 [Capronia epimyces CBS 606.96]
MFALEKPASRKRRRTSTEPSDREHPPVVKKPRLQPESFPQPHRRHRPASFWDTLSKIRLSNGALREFDRRNEQKTKQSYLATTPTAECPTGRASDLKRFSRLGGPDISHLRGFASLPLRVTEAMSDYSHSRSRKRSSTSSQAGLTRPSNTTTKSGNFEQKMIDNGVYPHLYEHPDGRNEKPANFGDIQARLRTARPSLSPSRFSDTEFDAFQRENARASTEGTTMSRVMPFLAGNEATHHRVQVDHPFNNLEPLAAGVSYAKPDVYYGAQPSVINPRVRSDLGKHIIPSTTTSRPVAPNFFLEGKGPKGQTDVLQRQALYNGALGARAMHSLQNYGTNTPVYDNNAYSFSSTYHDGQLRVYATHPTQSTVPERQSDYHMTQVRSFSLTDTHDRFREGVTAYRNIRDLAKEQRDSFIEKANQKTSQMRTSTSTTFTDSHASQSTPLLGGSDTSEDELARYEAAPAKRLRPGTSR